MQIKRESSLTLALLFFLLPLKAQVNIAVLEFEAKGMTQIEASILTDRLRTELFQTGKFVVIEREMMEEILSEQGFQQTGCISTECIVEIGRLVGVEQIIGGSVNKFGNLFSISARTISVQTGQIINTATYDHEGRLEDLLKFGMKKVADDLSGEEPEVVEMEEVVSPPVSQETKTPSISGDRSRITMQPGFFGFSYKYKGKKIKLKEVIDILKTDPPAYKEFKAHKRNKRIGAIIGIIGLAYTYILVQSSIEDFNAGRISEKESDALDNRAAIVLSATGIGQIYFIFKGNKQFFNAIDIFNGDIE